MSELKKGSKVIVNDPGLVTLYEMMKRFDPNCKPQNQGWVEEICDDGTIMVKFPIGDDNPDEHAQVAPYPKEMVVLSDWGDKPAAIKIASHPELVSGPANKPAQLLKKIHIYTDSELAEITELARKGYPMDSIAKAIGVSKSSFFRDYNNPALEVKQAYDEGLNKAVSKNIKLLKNQKDGKQAVKALVVLRDDLLATKIQNTIDEINYWRENEDL